MQHTLPNPDQPRRPRTPTARLPLRDRLVDWGMHAWRPASTALLGAMTLMLGWHVFHGRHGISSWQQNHTQEKQLHKEIDHLQQENSRLRVRVDRLKTDPEAIEHEAREKLHYARPGEVIVALPPDPPPQPSSPARQ